MLKRLTGYITTFLSALLNNILATILLALIGIPILISWATGTVNVLIQILKSPTPLWVIIILVLVALLIYIHLKKLTPTKPPIQKEIKTKKDISQTALKILIFLGKHGDLVFPVTFFYEKFNLTYNQAQYAIEELLNFNLLDFNEPYGELPSYWLSPKGRKFLSDKKLL